jgi:hypothetical protein
VEPSGKVTGITVRVPSRVVLGTKRAALGGTLDDEALDGSRSWVRGVAVAGHPCHHQAGAGEHRQRHAGDQDPTAPPPVADPLDGGLEGVG